MVLADLLTSAVKIDVRPRTGSVAAGRAALARRRVCWDRRLVKADADEVMMMDGGERAGWGGLGTEDGVIAADGLRWVNC